jgi:PAS domain S-box-containing protein
MNRSNQHSDINLETKDSERLQTLYIVNDMLKQVEADGLNINVILPRVLDLAVRQLNASDGSIIVVNEELQIEYAWPNNHPDTRRANVFFDSVMSVGVAGWVVRNKEPCLIDNTQADPRWFPRPGHATTAAPWSVICTPLVIRNRAIGALTIHRPGMNQFDGRDLNLLTAISNQAASSIENARLFETSQRQLQISALLNEASRVINSSLDIDEIMQSMLVQMNELLNAEAISIALVDKQTNSLVYRVAEGAGSDKIVGLTLPSNRGLSGWVMEHGKPAIVSDTSRDQRFHTLGDRRTGHHTRAMICAPMQFKGEVLGTIQAINPVEGTFTRQDLQLLINLANIASTAIANAQQYARTLEAEARYVSLFQDTVDPIILTDLRGEIVEANRRAIEMLGYGREELLGMKIEELHRATTTLPKAHRIRSDKVHVFTSKVIPKNNQLIPVEVYTKRTLYGDNELLQWIHHDISKQVELEEMRQDLTAMLFHDLQSPLGNVISSLELLAYEIPSTVKNSALFSMLDIAKRSSQRLQTLIRSLLDINRLEAGHPASKRTSVDIYDLIDEVREIERPNFEQRGIEFVSKPDSDLPRVYVEEDMIRRVLINLLGNAIKYSQESQHITVEATRLPGENAVMVSVSDQGTGIPPRFRQSIFEKFERIKQTDSASKGLGLGLAFCRLAVEAHSGRIWVDDAPGGGARFNFTLPLAPDDVAVSAI